jgi:hypothetical protein
MRGKAFFEFQKSSYYDQCNEDIQNLVMIHGRAFDQELVIDEFDSAAGHFPPVPSDL